MKQTDLEKLLADMSLKEKVDQMLQLSGAFYLGDENSVLTGPANDMGIGKEDLEMAGSILGAAGADTMKKLQDDYMAKQPHHIPMLFMMDVIHGMKTIFPAPLAQGATFDPELSGECASAAAKEASAAGLHVTFSPMVDLVRDARWGRVVESTGEDPYLNSRFSEAIVKGFQGDDLKTPGKVASCIKHFAGYGGAVAGRDYNTVELSEHTFREFYLPAYKAGIDAGAAMVMTSFNTINGVPASTNKWLMRDILRGEMGFDGVLISDFAAILETVAHRSSKDAADAAKKALEAGVDIDMMTSVYAANLCRLVEEGEVDEHLIDECCLRILELKNGAYRIIHDIAGRRRGTLSLAFAPERGMEMFMAVYPRFYQSYPEVTVTPREISVRRQLEMLAGDELDLGFISRPEGEVPGLTCVPLLREEFLLITPRSHPLAARAAPPGAPLTVLDTECLWDLTFCLIYRSSTQREVIDPLFERAGRKPNLFLETASNRANVSMVQKGLSCSIVPAYYVQGVEDVACFRLSAHPAWTVSACYRRNRYLSKSAQYFIALAAAYFRPECAAQEKELPQ